MAVGQLADYGIDAERGFLPRTDPLDRLPPYYEPWDRLAGDIGVLLMNGRLRTSIEALPALSTEQLDGPGALDRAMRSLCALANAYVWADEEPAIRIPAGLAVPLCQIAARLDRPPIVSHASLVLTNWRRPDPSKPLSLTNIDTLTTFLGGVDEKWFYLATVGVELAGAPALPVIVDMLAAVDADRGDVVERNLDSLTAIVDRTTTAFLAMNKWCDPHAFFHRVRPFLAGWPAPGVIYTGVSDNPQSYAGGSAAQSSLIQAFDIGLDIVHDGEHTHAFLADMRRYMPAAHRAFLIDLSKGASVREYASGSGALSAAYDRAIVALANLRGQHLGLTGRYISRFARADETALGTGGTDFVPMLRQARDESLAREIGSVPRS